jgi:hypothetical protein
MPPLSPSKWCDAGGGGGGQAGKLVISLSTIRRILKFQTLPLDTEKIIINHS